MSVSDIVQFVGTGGVPVVVAGTVLGVFELGDKLASQRAKDALSKWLLTFDVQRAGALPDGTRELFDRVFGERHFSLKCFVRSAVFSLSAMTLLGFLWLSHHQEFFLSDMTSDVSGQMWIVWNIFIDYISLLKTRFILRILTQMRLGTINTLAILGLDYILYLFLFAVGTLVIGTSYLELESPTIVNPAELVMQLITLKHLSMILLTPITPNWFFSIFFWAGFAPSLWMWLYVSALFVTGALARSERILNWLRWVLDVEKNPIRSIGAVAAALAFIASFAILLVFSLVSLITAAA